MIYLHTNLNENLPGLQLKSWSFPSTYATSIALSADTVTRFGTRMSTLRLQNHLYVVFLHRFSRSSSPIHLRFSPKRYIFRNSTNNSNHLLTISKQMFVKILFSCRMNVTFHVKRLIYFHFHKHKKILCVYSNIFYYFIIKRIFFYVRRLNLKRTFKISILCKKRTRINDKNRHLNEF